MLASRAEGIAVVDQFPAHYDSRDVTPQHDDPASGISAFKAPTGVDRRTVNATVAATLLLRFASRVSFSLLIFYLGAHLSSATVTVLVLEAYYITELVLAPIAGAASDRYGRKPLLVAAPVVGATAALWLLTTTSLLPSPNATHLDRRDILLLFLILIGRLLEGATTGLNAPAALGALVDATVESPQARVRALTGFEVATVMGLVLAIPFAGVLSARFGIRGFLAVCAIHALSILLLMRFVTDRPDRIAQADAHSLRHTLSTAMREPGIRSFLPAWCAVNAVVGAWITLGLLILTYSDTMADARFPQQLLYGGMSQSDASLLIGAFGALFLIGMGLWTFALSRMSTDTAMLIGLLGLAASMVALTIINGLGKDIATVTMSSAPQLLILTGSVGAGLLLLSGFPPAALSQIATSASKLEHQEGGVMGIYAFGLGAGQLAGAVLGGVAVDQAGLYGLIGFSGVMGLVALGSVLATRQRDSAGS